MYHQAYLDELGEFLFYDNVHHPGGDGFIEKHALCLASCITGQQPAQLATGSLEPA